MKRIIIESPYAGDIERNLSYLREAMRHALLQQEAPFASHAIYTQVLDDDITDERELGIQDGFEWGKQADLRAVYEDLGITKGMKRGIEHAAEMGQPIEFLSIR